MTKQQNVISKRYDKVLFPKLYNKEIFMVTDIFIKLAANKNYFITQQSNDI